MKEKATTTISKPAAFLATVTSIATLLVLFSLHILSPEFGPSWRMVSEYALGKYGFVLSLMFFLWGISSWALFFAIRSHISTRVGKIGLIFLILAGVGEFMGGMFDIKNNLHGLAALIGIPSLPIAAMLISKNLGQMKVWAGSRKTLLWTANLTWISLLLMILAFPLMIITFMNSGAPTPAEGTLLAPDAVLPHGVIGLVGWANRLLIVAYCIWVALVGWYAIKINNRK